MNVGQPVFQLECRPAAILLARNSPYIWEPSRRGFPGFEMVGVAVCFHVAVVEEALRVEEDSAGGGRRGRATRRSCRWRGRGRMCSHARHVAATRETASGWKYLSMYHFADFAVTART